MKRACVTRNGVGRRAGGVALAIALASVTGLGVVGCSSWQAANLYQSGTRALDVGALAQAVAELERAAELEPQRSEIRNHLGLAYAASGDGAAAEASFEAAVAIDCDNGAARRNLDALRAGKLRRMPLAEPDAEPHPDESARAPR